MRSRTHYIPIYEAEPGMVLGATISVTTHGVLRFSLPTGHALTRDNLHQMTAHRAEYLFISRADPRSDEQVAEDAAKDAHRALEIFSGADLQDPVMARLFDQVLAYRSA